MQKHQRDWEELGQVDPLWAILSVPEKQFGGWDVDFFFRTGEEEIRQVLSVSEGLQYLRQREKALDFGCGVGRLTRSLSPHFKECYGTDISTVMIKKAREMNRAFLNCRFLQIPEGDLGLFEDSYFDFIITRHVLQHLPSREIIRDQVTQLVRVLRPGGLLVFQLPTYIPLRRRLQPRRRAYAVLRSIGFQHRFLYEKLSLNPVRMSYLTEDEVDALLKPLQVRLVHTTAELISRDDISANSYYVTKAG